jgi:hypothetical protein
MGKNSGDCKSSVDTVPVLQPFIHLLFRFVSDPLFELLFVVLEQLFELRFETTSNLLYLIVALLLNPMDYCLYELSVVDR